MLNIAWEIAVVRMETQWHGSRADSVLDIVVEIAVVGFLTLLAILALASFKSEKYLLALPSLFISLLVFGAFVLFRDEWDSWRENIESASNDFGYYGLVAGGGTIFILLMSFEINRILARITKEENIIFFLGERLKNLAPSKEKAEAVLKNLQCLDDAGEGDDFKQKYEELWKELETTDSNIPQGDPAKDKIEEASIQLNELAQSRQHERGTSEFIAIILLGLFLLVVSLFLRPADNIEIAAVFVDLFALLFSTTVLYLIFYLVDLRRGRFLKTVTTRDRGGNQYGKILVYFQDTRIPWETRAQYILAATILVAYSVLYSLKWLG